jgi:Raf kinase inhibitor-like YbhB/YbcL family protein
MIEAQLIEGSVMSARAATLVFVAIASALVTACSATTHMEANPSGTISGMAPLPLTVTSEDFADGTDLTPTHAGCHGDNLNPQISWSEGPEGTVSYAIVMSDPDARYDHWLHVNIPLRVTSIERGGSTNLQGVHGQNSHRDLDYYGPCPPSQHHYVFTVYALDVTLDASETLVVASFLQEIEGHVLAQGSIMGLYPADS